MSSFVIGIDLGTSQSCVAVYRNKKIEIVPNETGKLVTPSYVSFTNKETLVGDSAKDRAISEMENTIYDVRRLIGRRYEDRMVQNSVRTSPFEIINQDSKPAVKPTQSNKAYYLEEMTSIILNKLKQITEKHCDGPVKDCIITVPAYFNDSQRQATIEAGKMAGLEVMRIINDSAAAAIAYSVDNKSDKERNIVVYDLGAGKLDVSVLVVKGISVKVLSLGGSPRLSGGDIDNRILNYVVDELKINYNKTIEDNAALRRLKLSCEAAKLQLSEEEEAEVEFDGVKINIGRDQFNKMCDDLFKITMEIVESCLRDAKIDKASVDDVILIGGSTNIPKIRTMIRQCFDKNPYIFDNSEQPVVFGATVLAVTLQNKLKTPEKEVGLVDVAPLSLGIKLSYDKMSVVIPKNTQIPVTKKKIFRLAYHNQTDVEINIYEGERTVASENTLLGVLKLTGIPPKPKNEAKIEVVFEIDEKGMLKVTGEEIYSNVKGEMQIEQGKDRTNDQINRIIEETLKSKEKDDNRRRISEVKNKIFNYCDNVLYKINSKECKSKMSKWNRNYVETECNRSLKWLNDNMFLDVKDYWDKYAEIESFCKKYVQY